MTFYHLYILFRKKTRYCKASFSTMILITCSTIAFSQPLQLFDSLSKKIEKISSSEHHKSRMLLDTLYQIADSYPDKVSLRRECIYRETVLNHTQGYFDSTLTRRINNELRQIDSEQEPYSYALILYSQALNLFTMGSYDEAFTSSLKAMKYFKQLNDSLFTAKTLNVLGRICNNIKSYKMAEDYYMEALKFCNPSCPDYNQIRSNMYIIWASTDRLKEAGDSLLAFVPILEKESKFGLLINYMNIAVFYSISKNKEQAYHYYMLAKDLNSQIDNDRTSILLHLNIGTYIEKENLQEAYKNIKQADSLAKKTNNPDLMALTLYSLSNIYDKYNKIDSAYFYLKEYQEIKKKIQDNAKSMDAYKAYISIFLEDLQKELIINEQEVMLKNRRLVVTIALSVGIILLITSWVIILYQQKRHGWQQTLLKDIENKELEERLYNKQLMEELQTERIEAQKREIISYTLLLSNKDHILQQIADEAKFLPVRRKEVKAIHEIIKSNLNTDRFWEDFMLHFEKVHPDFFKKLTEISKDLTKNDIQLCAYFRIGMSTKQIAQMLNVSPDSIKMHRYRIRKKLSIPENENFDTFMQNI